MTAYLRFEVLRTLRNKRFLLFVVAMPTFIYLINLSGDTHGFHEDGLGFRSYFLASMATYATMAAALAVAGTQLAVDRASGWLRQLRTTPLDDRSWIVAKLGQAAVCVVPSMVVLGLCGVLAGDVRISPLRWAAAGLTLLVGSVPFGLIGQALGQGLDSESAQPASVATMIGLAFVGGLFAPSGTLPALVRHLGQGTPTGALVCLVRDAMAGRAPRLVYVAVLGAWSALAAAAALLFRTRAVSRPAMA